MRHYRWWIVGLAFIGLIINYMYRSALGFAITPICAAFHLSDLQFGQVAAAFGIGYIVMTFLGGILVDRFGARGIWTLAALVWSCAAGAIGLASGLGMLIVLRVLLGLAEGPAFPALTRVTTDWLPMKERGRALALGLVAVPFSSVIGAPLITHLIVHFTWRSTFVILGVLGLIWAGVWWLAFKNSPSACSKVHKEELNYIETSRENPISNDKEMKRGFAFILFNPALLTNNLAFFAFGYLLFFGITWLPGYLEQSYGLNLHQVGLFLILPWGLASIALLLGGYLVDTLWRKTHSIRKSRSLVIALFQALSAISFLPAILFHNEMVAILSISFALSFGLLPNSCFYAINADLIPKRAATSLGVTDCFFAIAGILAPWLTGYLSNASGNFKIAIFVLMILSLGSSLLVLLFQHPDRYRVYGT